MREKNKITRRDFIKKVGLTTAVLGASSSLPKILKSAHGATRDHILIGRPLPITGPVSVFTTATPWLDNKAIADINKDGGIYIK